MKVHFTIQRTGLMIRPINNLLENDRRKILLARPWATHVLLQGSILHAICDSEEGAMHAADELTKAAVNIE